MTLLEMDNTIQRVLESKSSLYEAIDYRNWSYYIGDGEDILTVGYEIINMDEDMFEIKVKVEEIY